MKVPKGTNVLLIGKNSVFLLSRNTNYKVVNKGDNKILLEVFLDESR